MDPLTTPTATSGERSRQTDGHDRAMPLTIAGAQSAAVSLDDTLGRGQPETAITQASGLTDTSTSTIPAPCVACAFGRCSPAADATRSPEGHR